MTLDELDFKLILDDSDFQRKCQEVESRAKMLNTTLSNSLDIELNSLTKQIEKQGSVNELTLKKKKGELEIERAIRKERELALRDENRTQNLNARNDNKTREMELREKTKTALVEELALQKKINAERHNGMGFLNSQSKVMRELVGILGSYVSVMGAFNLAKNIIRVSAEFEKQRVSLEAILQDVAGADRIFSQIKELAVMSPFAFKELVTYTKQLSAYSIPMDQLYDTTKMLADVSAGLGVGMDRLVLAYGQIRSASFLRGQEVRQLTEAGIPILQELAKTFEQIEGRAFGVGEVFDKISRGQVTFEMVEQVFKNMTSEGGKFYQMQEVLADTLSGKLSNLKDAYEIMFSELGEKNSGALNSLVDVARKLIEHYEKVGKVLGDIVVAFGSYKLTSLLASGWKALDAYNARLLAVQQKALGAQLSVSRLTIAMHSLKGAMNFNVAIAAVFALYNVIHQAWKETTEFKASLDAIYTSHANDSAKTVDSFKRLAEELKNCNTGSENYRQAISKINNQYGEYLPKLLSEKNALEDLEGAYYNVIAAINAKQRALATEEGTNKIFEKYTDKIRRSREKLLEHVRDYSGFDEDSNNAFIDRLEQNIKNSSKAIHDVVQETVSEFFGKDSQYADWISGLTVDVGVWKQFGDAIRNQSKEVETLNKDLDRFFGSITTFRTKEEMTAITNIENEYKNKIEKINNTAYQSEKERSDAIKNIDIERLQALRDYYAQVGVIIDNGEEKAAQYNSAMVKQYEAQLTALQNVQKGWRANVNSVFDDKRFANAYSKYAAKDVDTATQYIDNLVKSYKELKEELTTFNGSEIFSAEQQEAKKNLEIIEAIASKLKINLNAIAGGSLTNPMVQALNSEANALKSLKDAYSDLVEYVDDSKAKEIMKLLFPDIAKSNPEFFSLDFKHIFGTDGKKTVTDEFERITESLKNLGDEGVRVADSLQNYFGKRDSKTWKEAFKAFNDYKKEVEEWLQKDFNISGEGVSLNISKIVANMMTDNNEVEEKAKKLASTLADAMDNSEIREYVREVFGDKFWNDYVKNGTEAIDKLANDEIEYNKKLVQQKIKDLTGDYAKELLAANNIDITNLSTLTMNQLSQLKEKISSITDVKITEELSKRLQEAGLDWMQFTQLVKKCLGDIEKDVDSKYYDKIPQKINNVTKAITSFANQISSLGNALGNNKISDLGKSIEEIASSSSKIVEGIFKEDHTKIFEGSVEAISFFSSAIISGASSANQLKEALRQVRLENEKIKASNSLSEGVETMFGDNQMASLRNARKIISEYKSLIENDIASLEDNFSYRNGYGTFVDKLGVVATAGAGGIFGYVDKIFKAGTKLASLEDLMSSTGGDIFGKYGTLNKETLQNVLDTYDTLSKSDREWISNAIKNIEIYEEAVEQLRGTMESLVGSLADDAVDAIVSQWREAGDAAADYASVIDSISESLARMMLKEVLLNGVFNDDFVDELTKYVSGGNIDKATNLIQEAFGKVESMAPTLEAILSEANLLQTEASNSGSLADGIKSITEDTANLLASYLNAIRADVSFNKMSLISISDSMKQLLSIFPSSPNLTEYIQQINANTYNSAENSRQILNRLDSVMGNGAEGSAFKVMM